HPPAPLAALARCDGHAGPDIGDIRKCECVSWHWPRPHRTGGGNAELGDVDAAEEIDELLGNEQFDRRLQAGSQPFRAAFELERTGNDAARFAQSRPALAQRLVPPSVRD